MNFSTCAGHLGPGCVACVAVHQIRCRNCGAFIPVVDPATVRTVVQEPNAVDRFRRIVMLDHGWLIHQCVVGPTGWK